MVLNKATGKRPNQLMRMMNGRVFVNWGETTSKRKAQTLAQKYRKSGDLARVLPLKRTQWGKKGWIVFKAKGHIKHDWERQYRKG